MVTTKFYVKQPKLPLTDEEINERVKKLIPVAPQDKYKKPLTENQMCVLFFVVVVFLFNKQTISDTAGTIKSSFATQTNRIDV